MAVGGQQAIAAVYEGTRLKSITSLPVELDRCQLMVSAEHVQVPDPPWTGLSLPEIGAPPFTLKVMSLVGISPSEMAPKWPWSTASSWRWRRLAR